MRFFQVIFWEFVQNLPLVVAFFVAVWLWAQNRRPSAIVCTLMGSVTGALVIRFTESNISDKVIERGEVTLINVVIMSFTMILCTAYLASESRYSNWKLDLVLGGGVGVLLSTAQGLATPGIAPIDWIFHCLAFTTTLPLALMSLRASKAKAKNLLSSLVISVFVAFFISVTISLVDYTEFLF